MRRCRLFRCHGRVVERFGGRFITGVDVGTNEQDMVIIGRETRWESANVIARVDGIYDTMRSVFDLARQEQIATYQAANRLAERRLLAVTHHAEPAMG